MKTKRDNAENTYNTITNIMPDQVDQLDELHTIQALCSSVRFKKAKEFSETLFNTIMTEKGDETLDTKKLILLDKIEKYLQSH